MFWWFTKLVKRIDIIERYANYLKERGYRRVKIHPRIIARSGLTVWYSPVVEVSVEDGKRGFKEKGNQQPSFMFRAEVEIENAAEQRALEWKQFFEERQFKVQMLPLMQEGPRIIENCN